MSVNDMQEVTDKAVCLTIGGFESGDLFELGKMMNDVSREGKMPFLVIIPTDAYDVLFDDGNFSENMEMFTEIQARHNKAMLDEYMAWKVLRADAKRRKKTERD